MSKPQAGDTVRVHYTGTLEDGTQFDSSRGSEPLEFAMGQGQLIAGFETALEPADTLFGRPVRKGVRDDMALGPLLDRIVADRGRRAVFRVDLE